MNDKYGYVVGVCMIILLVILLGWVIVSLNASYIQSDIERVAFCDSIGYSSYGAYHMKCYNIVNGTLFTKDYTFYSGSYYWKGGSE